MRFSWIDALVIAAVLRGLWLGHRRGLSGELLRFVGILCALYLSFRFCEPASDKILEHLKVSERAAIGLAGAGIFLAVIVFFYMLNQTVHRMMTLPAIAAIERGGGAVLGGAKALLFSFAVLVMLALVKVEAISEAVSTRSFFGPLAIRLAPEAYRFAVRVYPEAQSSPAEEAIEKLPPVGAPPRAEGGTTAAGPTPPAQREGRR
ncbi:MAG: CvpA family protein [bacterium]|nr:CvpA family protein [bacterium]